MILFVFFEQTVHYINKKNSFYMNPFRRESQNVRLVCKICKMEFLESQRTMRHMKKAHSKPHNANK
jgi:hypothetical protein